MKDAMHWAGEFAKGGIVMADFIHAIQADVIEACAADVEGTATFWDKSDQAPLEDAAACIRALAPKAPQQQGEGES